MNEEVMPVGTASRLKALEAENGRDNRPAHGPQE